MNHADPHNLEKCKDDCKLHWQNVKVSVEEVIKVSLFTISRRMAQRYLRYKVKNNLFH